MWEFLTVLLHQTGLLGLLAAAEALVILIVVKMYQKKDAKTDELQKQLLAMSEQRLEDVVEERQKYEALSQELKKSTNLLIQVFQKRAGLNGD